MDLKLLAWGLRRKATPMPRLWLFTDEHRLADPRASVASLPRGKAGVVLRHDRDPARTDLARDVARICRQRRLILVIAGDVRLAAAVRAGVHLRSGYWPGPLRSNGVVTSSAHSAADARRARKFGASVVFLSPAFPTTSHIGAPGLGPLRWAAMARLAGPELGDRGIRGGGICGGGIRGGGVMIAALGGVDGRSVRRLPDRLCRTIGAIGALRSS